MTTYFAGAYWGDRPTTLDQAAAATVSWLTRLKALHPVLRGWQPQGNSPAPRPEIPLTQDAFTQLLQAGHTDTGGPLGSYRISLWNGQEHRGAAFHVRCGATNTTIGVPNSVGLNLPLPSLAPELTGPDLITELLHATIETWRPDRALFIDTTDWARQGDANLMPALGWYTYFADSL